MQFKHAIYVFFGAVTLAGLTQNSGISTASSGDDVMSRPYPSDLPSGIRSHIAGMIDYDPGGFSSSANNICERLGLTVLVTSNGREPNYSDMPLETRHLHIAAGLWAKQNQRTNAGSAPSYVRAAFMRKCSETASDVKTAYLSYRR